MSTALALPVRKFETPASVLEMRAAELSIVDQASLERAAALLREVKDWRKQIETECSPLIRKAHELHKGLTSQRARLEAPFIELETDLKARVGQYRAEQKALADRIAAEEEAKARAAREEAQAEAQELEEAGQQELALVVRAQADEIQPAPPPPEARASGLAFSQTWKAKVEDMQAFLVAVLDGTIPINAVLPNEKVLGEQARSLKSELRWPGVKVWAEQMTAVR